jgi:hypothetical protein
MNEYNNPSFATMFQRALLNTCITSCFGLNPSHQLLLHAQQDALTHNNDDFALLKSLCSFINVCDII